MLKQDYEAFLVVFAFGAFILQSVQADTLKVDTPKRHHKVGIHKINAGPKQQYRNFWPSTIPIAVTSEGGNQSTAQINGRAYWNSLPASIRVRLNTFNKLQGYCQAHEGAKSR